jgi:hypothetical protein
LLHRQRWKKVLNFDARNVASEILKQLKSFMTESCSEMLEESAHLAGAGTALNLSRKKPKKSETTLNPGNGEESDFERVQASML